MNRVTEIFAAVLAIGGLAASSAAAAEPVPGPLSARPKFYTWARPIPPTPGRILRREVLPTALRISGAARAERILYSSTRGWGPRAPIVTSGMVMLPPGKAPKGGWPIIAWAHGTTGVADVCAPSTFAATPRDAQYLSGWLAQGYAVVATDYEGLGTAGSHPYMGSRSAAYSVLDSIRAARAGFPELGSRTVIVGQSQGAHAALVSGDFAPQYAPEIDIRGVVVTGVPGEKGFEPLAGAGHTSIVEAALIDPQTPRAAVRGLSMERFDGWALVYLEYFASYADVEPGFDPAEWLTPQGLALLREFETSCQGPERTKFLHDQPPLSAIFRKDPTPLEQRHVAARRYPTLALKMPIFVGIGLSDSYTSPEQAFNIVRIACSRETRATVRFYPGLGHAETVNPSQRDSAPFVARVMNGQRPGNDCPDLRWPGRTG